MLIDSNEARDNAKKALQVNEQIPVELAFITMNFNELPKKLIQDIHHTSIPFGQLLVNYHLKTLNTKRSYFSVYCNQALVSFIGCNLNSKIYGRTNTLIKTDNKQWVARVIEILPLVSRK
jgi:hypothetical protein